MDDFISREQATSIIQTWLKHSGYSEGERNMMGCTIQMLEELPSAQKTGQKMDELISRQAICDTVTARYPDSDATQYSIGYADAINDVIKDIRYMPSAQPEPKTGRWVECYPEGFWKCSECNFVSEAFAADVLYHYCPNCGTRMESEDKE